ncbi:pickpocket protein 28-like [Zophobas morio]|uniref:pickpocket protein 28-like n=1 Tax=Zophobas morio TaxID=2755281 RepID=UPI0030828D55
MTVRRICAGNETGDLELQKTNHTNSEDGKRNYSCGQNVRNHTMEFCSFGTIHGIRYFGENRTFIEKLWWALSLTLSLYFCISLIITAYIRWETSPVIVSFATRETPVWMIPFPSVTICPTSKTRVSVYNFTHYYQKKIRNEPLTEEEDRKLGYLSFLCSTNTNLNFNSGKFTDEKMIDFFEEVQPKFYEDSFDCKYLGRNYNCSDLFTPILTDVGICYTFNLMDRSQILSDLVTHHKNFHKTDASDDWTIEHGYKASAGLNTYPRRALYAGVPYGLDIKLKVHMDDLDSTCGALIKGFMVQIAHPQRLPRVRNQHFIVPLERVSKAGIAPDMMTTSDDVKRYNAKRRNCHFPSERPLKYFKVYTQNNCAIECRTNYTLSQCGCVPFYVPREEGVPICGAESLHCLNTAKKRELLGNVQKKINALNKVKSTEYDDVPDCQCLPICTSMYYNIENSQTPWDWRTIYKYNENPNVNSSDKNLMISQLQVFFKGNQFINSERNELYGSTEFLANVGGLLGLFIGFSALSFVEIIYYLTLRIVCNISMFGKNNWSGKTD